MIAAIVSAAPELAVVIAVTRQQRMGLTVDKWRAPQPVTRHYLE